MTLDGIEIARTSTTAKPDTTGNLPLRIGANSRGDDRTFVGDVDYIHVINPEIGTVYWNPLGFDEYEVAIPPPVITEVARTGSHFSVTVQRVATLNYSLWRTVELVPTDWVQLADAVMTTDGTATVTLTDTHPPEARGFYHVLAERP